MKKILICLLGCLLVAFFVTTQVFAHTPLCSCYQEEQEDGTITITCEGGFSDGSTGAGVKMIVTEAKDYKGDSKGKKLYRGKLIIKEGKMDENAEFTFKKPKVPYIVFYDAGPGHVVKIKGEDITE